MIDLRSTFWRALTCSAMLVTAASLLAGCISLFPKTDPAQLYRFGATPPPVAGDCVRRTGLRRLADAHGL